MTAAPTAADQRVAAWPSITRTAGQIYQLHAAGVLVETGDAFPTWCEDEPAARRFLRDRGFPADGPVVDL